MSTLEVSSLIVLVYKQGFSAAQWKEIGTWLNLPSGTLDVIERDNHCRSRDCLREMIVAWLRYDDSATLEKFRRALSNCKSHQLYQTLVYVMWVVCFGLGMATASFHNRLDPVKGHVQPISIFEFKEDLRVYYRDQPNVPGIKILWYDKADIEFIPPVLYNLDLRQDYQTYHSNDSKELYFDSFFSFTGHGQRILIQGRPGSGKTTLANRLTKEWANQTDDYKIAECPLLLRVKLRELSIDRPSGENLSLSDILRYSMSNDTEHIDEQLSKHLSRPKNAENLCIIFDGLDEYPPAYSDSNNYIYEIINRQKLRTATVIVFSRPEAYKTFFENSGEKGYPVYQLIGFNLNKVREYVTSNIPDQEHAERFLSYLDEKPAIHQLCTSPLHLTMFVESYKIKYEFPSTLTKAYSRSLSKAIKREIRKKELAIDCSKIDLEDFSSLRECSHDLADAILNVSRLAFDTMTEFSDAVLHVYLPSGESYGLLSSHYRIVDGDTVVCRLSFPHKLIQYFWSAYYAGIVNLNFNLTDHDDVISKFTERSFLHFLCSLYSSNDNKSILQILLQLHPFDVYVRCGLESGFCKQSLAGMYLEQHESINLLFLDYVELQPIMRIILLKVKHIRMTQSTPQLRRYFKNNTYVFSNLEKVSIYVSTLPFTCSFNFTDNLRLVSSGKTIFEWELSLDLLSDQCVLDCLDGVISTEMEISLSITLPLMYDRIYSFFVFTELTPDLLTANIEKFVANFPKLTGLRVLLEIDISSLECQFIQALLENFCTSSIFKIRNFKMVDFDARLTLENIRLLEDSYTEVLTERIILHNEKMEMLIPIREYSRFKRIPQCMILTDENMKLCKTEKVTVYTYKPKLQF